MACLLCRGAPGTETSRCVRPPTDHCQAGCTHVWGIMRPGIGDPPALRAAAASPATFALVQKKRMGYIIALWYCHGRHQRSPLIPNAFARPRCSRPVQDAAEDEVPEDAPRRLLSAPQIEHSRRDLRRFLTEGAWRCPLATVLVVPLPVDQGQRLPDSGRRRDPRTVNWLSWAGRQCAAWLLRRPRRAT